MSVGLSPATRSWDTRLHTSQTASGFSHATPEDAPLPHSLAVLTLDTKVFYSHAHRSGHVDGRKSTDVNVNKGSQCERSHLARRRAARCPGVRRGSSHFFSSIPVDFSTPLFQQLPQAHSHVSHCYRSLFYTTGFCSLDSVGTLRTGQTWEFETWI